MRLSSLLLPLLLAGSPAHYHLPESANGQIPPEPEAHLSASLNLLQLQLIALPAIMLPTPITYLPFYIDITSPAGPGWDMNLGLTYRYENYHLPPGTFIWQDQHELFITVGPRVYLNDTGRHEGWFWSLKTGPGLATSPSYRELSWVFQGDIGQVQHFGVPGMTLTTGFGLLLNLPLHMESQFSYSPSWDNLSFVGYLMHRIIPIFNVSLGYAFF